MRGLKIFFGNKTQLSNFNYYGVVYCKDRKLIGPHLKINSRNSYACLIFTVRLSYRISVTHYPWVVNIFTAKTRIFNSLTINVLVSLIETKTLTTRGYTLKH